MKILILAIGKIKTLSLEQSLIESYLKRIPWEIEIKEFEEKKALPKEQLQDKEGELLLSRLPDDYKSIVLDEKGKSVTSANFANYLNQQRYDGNNKVAFLIGGANGHGEKVKKRADLLLSLGLMTWPHIIARILLTEQLYRAYTIINNHPYHKN